MKIDAHMVAVSLWFTRFWGIILPFFEWKWKSYMVVTHGLQGHKCFGVVGEKGVCFRLSGSGLTTYSPLWDPISLPVWWVSRVSGPAVSQRLAGGLQSCTSPPETVTKSPQCTVIIYVQKNLLSTKDGVVTLRAGKTYEAFILSHLRKLRCP